MDSVTTFSFVGDSTQTLNTLTGKEPTNHTLLELAASFEVNQLVFMNQPMSWWMDGLNNSTIRYTPLNNEVNWSYVDGTGQFFEIGLPISDLIIPNTTGTCTPDFGTKIVTCISQPKFGMTKTGIFTM
jgi:hypothetical protein